MVACSQPLAAAAGIKILDAGGTAADAAVAIAAALNVVEPCSTGIGGDAFVLYFDESNREVTCLMGNGAAPNKMTIEYLNSLGYGIREGDSSLPKYSGLCVTVPGAAALWEDLVNQHGKMTLSAVLQPAISLAEEGFILAPMTANQWAKGTLQGIEAQKVFRPDGVSPIAGSLVRNVDLAQTFRTVAELGARDGFYSGRIGEAIVNATNEFGGVMELIDLQSHVTEKVQPISTVYKEYRVYEVPPPSQGLAALMGLNMIENYELCLDPQLSSFSRGSSKQAHAGIECMRAAFADALGKISDPKLCKVPVDALLNPQYIASRVQQLNVHAVSSISQGDTTPYESSETVYFCVIDGDGNGCSMINSNYMGFGTGIVPKGCGFTLQNRGFNFSLDPNHANCIAPYKRPYHTIIPCLMTHENDGTLYSTLGVMGGFMQPQGHFQVIRNLVDFHMNPQEALDAPRWYIDGLGNTQSDRDLLHNTIYLEDGYGGNGDESCYTDITDRGEKVRNELISLGHCVGNIVKGSERSLFGRGQIIVRNRRNGVTCAGSDPRADGCAMPQI
jgi:gamma-glutamyltranspeptidase/glutathione hydrolase